MRKTSISYTFIKEVIWYHLLSGSYDALLLVLILFVVSFRRLCDCMAHATVVREATVVTSHA